MRTRGKRFIDPYLALSCCPWIKYGSIMIRWRIFDARSSIYSGGGATISLSDGNIRENKSVVVVVDHSSFSLHPSSLPTIYLNYPVNGYQSLLLSSVYHLRFKRGGEDNVNEVVFDLFPPFPPSLPSLAC